MRKLIYLPGAQADYQEALLWYHQQSPTAAHGFELAIDNVVSQILQAPERWAKHDRRHHRYQLDRYPFSIISSFNESLVVIVAVAHALREPGYWRSRSK